MGEQENQRRDITVLLCEIFDYHFEVSSRFAATTMSFQKLFKL